ncbi:hypothetical protein RJ639_010315 [Escallonia herrerae]|uniref:Protein kinase domain-containing protein n=1 Tax=Escallonia herrerae TaxID=1293975 RepID=A0AA88VQK5_9ASTE|nr:hypothetical protein RJ639_010315 [Escallonia herrerae]
MEWVRGDRVGHGSFGTVNLAVPRSQNPEFPPLMAVKSCSASHSASLMNEKLILDELRNCSPQIIQCFGDDFSLENGEKLYNILLEFASGGALADKLKSSCDRRFLESDVRWYTKSILKGLLSIHQRGGPFDFPDGVSTKSSVTCSINSLPSAECLPEYDAWFQIQDEFSWSTASSISPSTRLRQLVSDGSPDWSVSDNWTTVSFMGKMRNKVGNLQK